MPLDPQVATLLEQFESFDWPPVTGQTPAEFRESFRAMIAIDSKPEAPVDARDATVPGSGGDIPIRIFRPPDATAELPVVVYLHGGGWVIGDLDTHDGICRQLAAGTPAVVVSVDYRLAPEHRFPAALEDAWAATGWVADHGDELGGDTGRLAVAGDSAGGNLAAAVAIRARDAGGPRLAFQLLVYPVTDLTRAQPSYVENGQGYMLTSEAMAWFVHHYLGGTDPTDPEASPLFAADLSGLPPALVMTAEFDPLRDEGEAYAARLAEAGVPARLRRYDGMIHGFLSMGGLIEGAKPAVADAVDALRAGLAPARG